ncbi:SMI1/KNR4 family protein [Cytobacillus sp. IB215316]|uniref:SMI1/KNR4 family protein n=1 Tax=Cytobacillus sp. IB215316 TaxID=3097354 RepID=UPI002A105A77|nr:SMI1/KNR4 family protein [Cytobacillus sp. IB215316]MDX8363519.1 SMI1/KNR4 family protein [Cytobacillus sp. IB215316]
MQPAATEKEIELVEEELNISFPEDFRQVLLNFTKSLHFYWFLKNDEFKVFQNSNFSDSTFFNMGDIEQGVIDCGGILDNPLWSLDNLIRYDTEREMYEFLDDDGTFIKKHWENKNTLIFTSFGNGGHLGIDLKYNKGEVIYLTTSYHMHGLRLGENFSSFFENWINLSCAGHWGEDFYLFSSEKKPYLSMNSFNGIELKSGLNKLM